MKELNSLIERIGIPRNGFNTFKSASPLMMQSALVSKASRRNISKIAANYKISCFSIQLQGLSQNGF
jgi:hypothetical protein